MIVAPTLNTMECDTRGELDCNDEMKWDDSWDWEAPITLYRNRENEAVFAAQQDPNWYAQGQNLNEVRYASFPRDYAPGENLTFFPEENSAFYSQGQSVIGERGDAQCLGGVPGEDLTSPSHLDAAFFSQGWATDYERGFAPLPREDVPYEDFIWSPKGDLAVRS